MNLTQFKDWAIGQGSVAKYDDGGFSGECVSLINQYCYRVLGIPAKAWGHAKDWGTNQATQQYFNVVGSPQAGDIGVSGAVAGNPYGHIWIYLSPNQILEQNGKVSRRVSVSTPYIKPIRILRSKSAPAQGGIMAVDKNMLNNLYLAVFGRKPDAGANGYIGKPADVVLQQLLDAPEETQFEKAARLEAKVNELQEKLDNSDGSKFKEVKVYVKE